MRKLFFLFIIWPFLCQAQTKPRNPIAPSGTWANGLFRAWAFSPADSINGNAVNAINDWSGQGGHGSPAVGSWTNGGNESPIYTCPSCAIDGKTGWNTLITDKITIVQRLKLTCNGSCWSSISGIDGGTTLMGFWFTTVGFSNTCIWNVRTSSTASINVSNTLPNNSFTTYILSYGGDSIRAWQDGIYKGSAPQTGNIALATNSTYDLGLSFESGFFRNWSGGYAMTCAWNRELTNIERNAIWNDPYVMFKISEASTPIKFKGAGFKFSEFKNKGFK